MRQLQRKEWESMNIDVKYDVGDKVVYKKRETEFREETCSCCGGKGSIIGVDGKTYICGHCDGSGTTIKGPYVGKIVEKEGIVQSVHVRYDSDKGRVDSIYYYFPREEHCIYQKDILGKIIDDSEKLAYTE